jgi:hypothetical protein
MDVVGTSDDADGTDTDNDMNGAVDGGGSDTDTCNENDTIFRFFVVN